MGTSFDPSAIVVSTSIVAFLSGFMLGVYSIRGYLISPELAEERRRNFADPVESEESDIDEDDTILDHAPNWVNGEDADRRDGLRLVNQGRKKKNAAQRGAEKKPGVGGSESTLVDIQENAVSTPGGTANFNPNEECKLVLVVRTDLGMTKGKIAAQCSHATLACYKALSRRASTSPEGQLLRRWERTGQAKIAVQVKSEQELLDLMAKAHSLGLTAEVIQDAGRTQIEAGSRTVLGVGPAPKSLVDQVTGGLKLL